MRQVSNHVVRMDTDDSDFVGLRHRLAGRKPEPLHPRSAVLRKTPMLGPSHRSSVVHASASRETTPRSRSMRNILKLRSVAWMRPLLILAALVFALAAAIVARPAPASA